MQTIIIAFVEMPDADSWGNLTTFSNCSVTYELLNIKMGWLQTKHGSGTVAKAVLDLGSL